MKIGSDNKGNELKIGDICKFTIEDKEYEGMVGYSEDYFAFSFDMLDDRFPCVLMSKADLGSIEKIVSVWSTNVNEEKYAQYRELAKV